MKNYFKEIAKFFIIFFQSKFSTLIEEQHRFQFLNKNPKYSKYSIGDYSYGEPIILSWENQANLTIGKFCSISSNVRILLGGEHRTDWVTTYPFSRIFAEFQHIQGHPTTKGE